MSTEPEPDLRAGYRQLALAARLVQRRQDEALAPLGLTRAAVMALEGIATGPRNQEQLAGMVHVKTQTVGKVLARLQARGLLTRTRYPSDRRQLLIELTGAGEEALAAARKAEIDAFPAEMDADHWRVLQQELAKFVGALQPPQRGSETSPEPTRLRAVPGTETPGEGTPVRGSQGKSAPPTPSRAGNGVATLEAAGRAPGDVNSTQPGRK